MCVERCAAMANGCSFRGCRLTLFFFFNNWGFLPSQPGSMHGEVLKPPNHPSEPPLPLL